MSPFINLIKEKNNPLQTHDRNKETMNYRNTFHFKRHRQHTTMQQLGMFGELMIVSSFSTNKDTTPSNCKYLQTKQNRAASSGVGTSRWMRPTRCKWT